jgi:hypothetical protein
MAVNITTTSSSKKYLKVYYDLFQWRSPEKEEVYKVLDNIGRVTVPADFDVGDLIDAIYKREEHFVRHCSPSQLNAFPHGIDIKSPTFKRERIDIDSKIPVTNRDSPLIITIPANEALINKRKLEDLLKTTQIVLSDSGTRKSAKLAKVKPKKFCFCAAATSLLRHHMSFRNQTFLTKVSRSSWIPLCKLCKFSKIG